MALIPISEKGMYFALSLRLASKIRKNIRYRSLHHCFKGMSGCTIDGNYPLVITTATVVITITPFLGNFYGNFA